MLTPKLQSILVTMAKHPHRTWSPSTLARAHWPKPPGAYIGARSGQWQAMGAQLSRLSRSGCVVAAYDHRHGTKDWSLTGHGLAIARALPTIRVQLSSKK